MAAVAAVVIGGGNRGRFTYGAYALAHPDRLRVVALAEPHDERRSAMAVEHGLAPGRALRDWQELLAQSPLAPVAIVATGDSLHVAPALAALARGYHVLLEKPIALDAADCIRVVEAAERAGRLLQIAHPLRYTAFYAKIHEIVSSGRLGDPLAFDLKEHVAHWHMAHSYVRGKFRKREIAAPLVLAKTCHDLDLLLWLAGRAPRRVASFGSLEHYRAERAPAGAPERCTDGCPVQAACPHDAERFYLAPDDALARLWPWADLGLDPSREARRRALESGPYGRCVYRCDNDVVDHQVLAIELEGGATASFTVHGLATHERRTVRVSGSRGELRGVLQEGLLEVTRHGSSETERHRIEGSVVGHFGGDDGLLDHFTARVARGVGEAVLTSGRSALDGHLLGFAAEEARRHGVVVDVPTFRAAVERSARA